MHAGLCLIGMHLLDSMIAYAVYSVPERFSQNVTHVTWVRTSVKECSALHSSKANCSLRNNTVYMLTVWCCFFYDAIRSASFSMFVTWWSQIVRTCFLLYYPSMFKLWYSLLTFSTHCMVKMGNYIYTMFRYLYLTKLILDVLNCHWLFHYCTQPQWATAF